MTKTRYTKADRRPTWTHLVLDRLITADDFMTAKQLQLAVGSQNLDQITAALAHLREHRAVDSTQSGGHLWWFATPDGDNRTRQVHERVEEPKGNRGRVKRVRARTYDSVAQTPDTEKKS